MIAHVNWRMFHVVNPDKTPHLKKHLYLSLYGLMDLEGIPPAIRKLIHNYPINLIQINTFEGVERFKTDLKAVFGF